MRCVASGSWAGQGDDLPTKMLDLRQLGGDGDLGKAQGYVRTSEAVDIKTEGTITA